MSVVFGSPVQSGFLGPRGDGPRPGPVYQCPRTSKNQTGLQKTGKNRSRPVLDIPGLKAIYIGYNYLFVIFCNKSP